MAKKILLADDSLTIQKVVELTFSDGDYDLVCVSNGQKALDKVRDDRPDLILADVVMPEKNGYEVCEAIKGNPATARIPVVLLSGTFEPFDRDRAERIGCDAIVSKPFDSQQLISQVEGLLGKARAEMPEPEDSAEPGPAAGSSDSDHGPFDAGFSSEDFTASIRVSPRPERFDPFEEEYGRGDADAAILAFERAHPEFAGSAGGDSGREASPRGESPADAPWLIEEPEPVSTSPAPAATPRGGIWAPQDEEPAGPLEFDAERTGSSRPRRADDGPTQEIPQQAFRPGSAPPLYPSEPRAETPGDLPGDSFGGRKRPWETPEPQEISADDAEVLFDVGSSEDGDEEQAVIGMPAFSAAGEEQTEEFAAAPEAAASSDSGRPDADADAGPEAEEAAPADARELEALAQTASIPELTTMLSSVMRSGGELSDAEIDRLAQRVVEKLSDRIVREIAWEVIPDMAEIVIKERIKELESGVE